jgi:hypothetical protein
MQASLARRTGGDTNLLVRHHMYLIAIIGIIHMSLRFNVGVTLIRGETTIDFARFASGPSEILLDHYLSTFQRCNIAGVFQRDEIWSVS